ncbi:hypothetical protein IT417_02845 [bacterium]|nr:hypothetical protein [bacterium]
MDIAQINALLDSLEDLFNKADETIVKPENKVFVLAGISNLRDNPTSEELEGFLDVIKAYATLPSEQLNAISAQESHATQPQVPSQTADDSLAQDQARLKELLEKLNKLNQSAVQE